MIIMYRSWAKNVVVAHKSPVTGAATMAAADGGGGKGGAGGGARAQRETGGKVGDSSSSRSSRGTVEGLGTGGGGGGGGGGQGRGLLSERTIEGAHQRESQNDVKPPPRPFRVRVD
jgi:hypothetical protein